MLKLEILLRILSSAVCILFAVFFPYDTLFYRTPFFYAVLFYALFLLAKKYIYFWPLRSPYNYIIELVEWILILYIHWMSQRDMAIVLYIAFLIRMGIIYSPTFFKAAASICGLSFLIINMLYKGVSPDKESISTLLYHVTVFIGAYYFTGTVLEIDNERTHQSKQLKDLLDFKESLMEELDRSRQRLRQYDEQLNLAADTDSLTGLYNYKYFQEFMDAMFQYLKENNGRVSLIMIGFIGVGEYNRLHGQPEGDRLFMDLAGLLKDCIGDDDILVRYSQYEFALILPGQGKDKALELCGKIGLRFEKYKEDNPKASNVNISMGAASNIPDVRSKEELVRKAVYDMFLSKKTW